MGRDGDPSELIKSFDEEKAEAKRLNTALEKHAV